MERMFTSLKDYLEIRLSKFCSMARKDGSSIKEKKNECFPVICYHLHVLAKSLVKSDYPEFEKII